MYQINLRVASKLAALTTRWPFARAQQHAEPHQRRSPLRAARGALANLATRRVMPSSAFDTTERHDPRDPRNW